MNEAIQKYSLSINPEMDWEAEHLQFTTTVDGISRQLYRDSVCFKEKVVRETLIALGWTPPNDSLVCFGMKVKLNPDMPPNTAAILQKGEKPQIITFEP